MPFQIRTKCGTGSFTVIVSDENAAVERMRELLERGHSDVEVFDLEGRKVEFDEARGRPLS